MPKPEPRTLGDRARPLLQAIEDALPACTRCQGLGFVSYPAGYPGPEDVLRDVPCDAGGCPYVAIARLNLLIGEADAALVAIGVLASTAKALIKAYGRLPGTEEGEGEGVAGGP